MKTIRILRQLLSRQKEVLNTLPEKFIYAGGTYELEYVGDRRDICLAYWKTDGDCCDECLAEAHGTCLFDICEELLRKIQPKNIAATKKAMDATYESPIDVGALAVHLAKKDLVPA